MQHLEEILDDQDKDFYGNDISFLTSLRIKQEKKNLEKYLRFLERQRRRSLEMYEYQKEQTELDLQERVKLKSSYFADLWNINDKKKAIAVSRRESLNVIRAHNGRTWNMATNTYHVAPKRHEKREKIPGKPNFHVKYFWHIRKDILIRREATDENDTVERSRSNTTKTRSRFPFLRRENTDFVVQPGKHCVNTVHPFEW